MMKNRLPLENKHDAIEWHLGVGATQGFEALLIACSDTSKDGLGCGHGERSCAIGLFHIPSRCLHWVCFLEVWRKLMTQRQHHQCE